jgi:multiple sugar transport system permease protein
MEAATATPSQAVQPRRRRRKTASQEERSLARKMIAPSLILIALVAAYPIAYAVWLSLHEYSVINPGQSRWAGSLGLRNYSNAFSDPEFRA